MAGKLKNFLHYLEPTAPPAAQSSELSLLDEFRASLALRGWTDPGRLIDDIGETARKTLLSSLAANVLTASQSRPGQWFLDNEVRVRTLASVPRETLQRLVEPQGTVQASIQSDADDPVRQAFSYWLNDATQPLSELATPVLSALQQIQDWTSEELGSEIAPVRIEAELAARQLHDDLHRLTQFEIVGKGHKDAIETLYAFATVSTRQASLDQSYLGAVYMYGSGGNGKSTVLAALQQRFTEALTMSDDLGKSEGQAKGAIARIDFDEPSIDPGRMATLNLRLFEQLCRSLPALEADAEDIIADLRGQVRMQLAQEVAEMEGDDENQIIRHSRSNAESISFLESSDSGSLLSNLLGPHKLDGPLVLVLDTAELVLGQSDSKAAGIIKWLSFLRTDVGVRDMRLIIAGRDPPPDAGAFDAGPALRNLLDRLQDLDLVREPDIRLGLLEPTEAAQLLRNVGLKEEKIIEGASRAVPGNPLLLRITATALQTEDSTLKNDVIRAHAMGQIDRKSAETYLMHRIVAHVTDPVARPYVLGAMVSPVLTADLLQHAIIPAIARDVARGDDAAEPTERDIEGLSQRVFEALRSTHWLCRPSLDPDTLIFERNIRDFVLDLFKKVHLNGVLMRDIGQSAVIYHRRKLGPMHRAMALYHAALLGIHYSHPTDRDSVRPWLRDVQGELPLRLQQWLEPPQPKITEAAGTEDKRQKASHTITSQRYTDEEWRIYLEGKGNRDGEGMRLVKHDHAREALMMYRERPTREPGMAPTFVIRALSDLGVFDQSDVDLAAKLDQGWERWVGKGRSLSPRALSEIYWLTRYALLRDSGSLSGDHAEILVATSRKAKGPGLTEIPALIAVAEAVQQFPIMDDRMRRAVLKSGNELRILLGVMPGKLQGFYGFSLKQLAVVQNDWAYRVHIAVPGLEAGQKEAIARAQWIMNDLAKRPLAEVNQVLEKLRGEIRIAPHELDWPTQALLFRGFTHEFHKPLREAMWEAAAHPNPALEQADLEQLFAKVLSRMTITPDEMTMQTSGEKVERNVRAWISGFIAFADQARLLPLLVDTLAASTDDARIQHLSASFQAWDRALCRGGSSSWVKP